MRVKRSFLSLSTAIVLAVSLTTGSPARADGVLNPQHGGRMAEVQGQRLELVMRDGTVDVYISNHDDQPMPTDGMNGKAILLVGDKKAELLLQPIGGNRLSESVPIDSGTFSTAIVTINLGDKTLTARFGGGQCGNLPRAQDYTSAPKRFSSVRPEGTAR